MNNCQFPYWKDSPRGPSLKVIFSLVYHCNRFFSYPRWRVQNLSKIGPTGQKLKSVTEWHTDTQTFILIGLTDFFRKYRILGFENLIQNNLDFDFQNLGLNLLNWALSLKSRFFELFRAFSGPFKPFFKETMLKAKAAEKNAFTCNIQCM